MTEYNVDTVKMRECGKDIMHLSTELNELLLNFFDRMEKIPVQSKEWVGKSAEQFVHNIQKSKGQYFHLKDAIYEDGKLLSEYAGEIENEVMKLEG